MMKKIVIATLAAVLLLTGPAVAAGRWPFPGKNGGRAIAKNIAERQMRGVLGNYTNVKVTRIYKTDQIGGPYTLIVGWTGRRERVDNGQEQFCDGSVWIDSKGLPFRSGFRCRPQTKKHFPTKLM